MYLVGNTRNPRFVEKNRGLDFLFKIAIPESPVGYEHSAHLSEFFILKTCGQARKQ